jgi:hypothetical protein
LYILMFLFFYLSSEACLRKMEEFCNLCPDSCLKASRIIDNMLYNNAPQVCSFILPCNHNTLYSTLVSFI